MSENTVSYGDFVRALFNASGDPSKDFTHAILGVVTEIHEYLSATDEVNGLEELGDLAFYVQALRQVVEDHTGVVEEFELTAVEHLFNEADIYGAAAVTADVCNSLLDDAKRWVGYGKEPRNLYEVLCTVQDLAVFVNDTGLFPCHDVARIQAANRAKLNTRYQNGVYTQAQALNRNLESERAVLASH